MRYACGLALVLATGALAHEDEHDFADAGVTPSRETTVRGARPPRAASEALVERDVIAAAPRTSAIDLLRLAPGVVASQHSGEGKAAQLFLRGFDAVHGQDVELNVAGLPVNEPSHLHALGYADLSWLIPEVVREVRVTPGSPRAAQGDFAIAGTLRYELGLDEEGLTGALTVGSFGRQRLFLGLRPKGAPTTFAAVEHVRGDGFGPARAFSRTSALGQGAGRLGPLHVRAVAGAFTSTFESPGVVRDDAWRAGQDFFAANGAGQGGEASRFQGLVAGELPLAHGRVGVELFGVHARLALRNNFTGFLAAPPGDGLEQRQRTGTLGARVTHHGRVHVAGQHLHVEAGAQVRHDDLEQRQRPYAEADGAPGSATVAAHVAQTLGSGWTELALQPGPWRFMVGARLDVLRVRVDDALRPGGPRHALGPHLGLKAAVERQLGHHARLFLTYGDGLRSPQARQLSDGEGAPFVTARSLELGGRVESSVVSASLAGFGTFVAQDFFFDHALGTTRFVGPTLRGGITGAVTARPGGGLLAALNLTVAGAERLERAEPLPYVAPLVGRLDLSWTRTFEVRGLRVEPRLGLGATGLGPRPLPFGEWSAPVLLLDARAALRLGPLALALDVQNLLDARWRDGEFVYASRWPAAPTPSLLPARHFTAGTPRTVFLTLEVHR